MNKKYSKLSNNPYFLDTKITFYIVLPCILPYDLLMLSTSVDSVLIQYLAYFCYFKLQPT